MIQIHQAQAPLSPGFFAAVFLREGDLATVTLRALRAGQHAHVADVSAFSLEEAFSLTQNLDAPWTNGHRVRMRVRGQCRSTMTGDVFIHRGQAFVVAHQGFLPLPQETAQAA